MVQEIGSITLAPRPRARNTYWNKIPDKVRTEVIDMALDYPEESSRGVACKMIDEKQYYISESSVYRILKANGLITQPAFNIMAASNEFKEKTTGIQQMWQTDFTYLKITGWGWYYLSTILDDYSRYIVHWELCSTMHTKDVTRTIETAPLKAGLSQKQRPKLLSDNGPCYISHELKQFISDKNMEHIRGRPLHPQTQGKIERYHRSMKNIIKLEHYYMPGELIERLAEFVDYYNTRRYHESLQNVTQSDVYFGRAKSILDQRRITKEKTMRKRRKTHLKQMLNI